MAITINILSIKQSESIATGETYQHAEFTITDGVDEYLHSRGSIPDGADVQSFLDAEADALWAGASAQAKVVDSDQVDFAGVIGDIQTEIDYLNLTIPLIDTMTAVQVRDVVKRLAQENRGILRALRWVAKRID